MKGNISNFSKTSLIALFAICAITSSVMVYADGSDYTVSSGNQDSTYKNQNGQQPPKNPKPNNSYIDNPRSEPAAKTIMLQTFPVNVPARVQNNTVEKADSPHAGENEGAVEGLGSAK